MKAFSNVGLRFNTSINKLAGIKFDDRLLRIVMGVLGVALPVIIVVWGSISHHAVQDSISDYYSWRTRDAFVGILFVIGWILFAYKGHHKIDAISGKLACLFALGVAFFSNTDPDWRRIVHFVCAVCLFGLLAFFSLYLFTRTELTKPEKLGDLLSVNPYKANKYKADSMSDQKKARNRVYIACGSAIIACIVLVGVYYAFLQNTPVANARPVLILETLMVWAFGISWFVKGDTVLKDKPKPAPLITETRLEEAK